jgi:glycosyltransferase involved in cell wall biosynthesis
MPQVAKRVVHLSSAHPWDDNRIYRRECRSLARAGYAVTLVAVGSDPRPQDGVLVHALPPVRGRLRRLLVQVPKVLNLAWRARADIYHLHDPELIPIIPILRLRGAKVVYDAHEDLTSQVCSKHYLPDWSRPTIARVAELLCRLAGCAASHVVAATAGVARQYRSQQVTVVRNYPESLDEQFTLPSYEGRDKAVIYLGAIGKDRGAVEMVDAMEVAQLGDDWKLLLVGPHAPEGLLEELRARPGWRHVKHRGRVGPLEARRKAYQGRIGLVVLHPTPAYVEALPTKLFEYMDSGIPVVASDFPVLREIVAAADCGVLVDPHDVGAIGRALKCLASDPALARRLGENGRRAVRQRYNWDRESEKLRKLYADLIDA